MRKIGLILLALILFVIILFLIKRLVIGLLILGKPKFNSPISLVKEGKDIFMDITSSAFSDSQPIPPKYTCDGENISPPLTITGIPKAAQSLVVIMDDPDAPAGTWIHWLVWNISPNNREINENTVPIGAVQGTNSFKTTGYGGPCPPNGTHRYYFRIYALDTTLSLFETAKREELEEAMKGHVVNQGELIGVYSQK